MSETVKSVLGGLKKRFRPGAAAKSVTYYFSLGDDEKWTLTLSAKSFKVAEGKVENADCVLKTSPELFCRMMTGAWRPGFSDFLSGKMKSNAPELLKVLAKAFDL